MLATQQKNEPTRKEAQLELIRRDSYRSMRYLGGFDYVPLHAEWHQLLNTIPKFALKAPTGHAKTTNFLYHIAWKIGMRYYDPNLFIKLFCSNFRESKFRVQMVGEIIKTPEYQALFPWVKPDKNNFNKEYLMFHVPHISKDPQLMGVGFDSEFTGVRTSDGYFDDVVGFASSLKLNTQRRYKTKFKTDVMNRMIPGARLHYIYTPWTENDLSSEIEKEKWLPIHEYSYGNYEIDKKLLWESYWTKKEVERKRDEEPVAYKQGFLLIPITSELRKIFDIQKFKFVDNILLNENLRPDCALDLATGRYEESGGELDRYSLTIGFNFKTYKYVHDIILIDKKVDKVVELVGDYDKKFNFGKIVFESNAWQYVFGDLLPPHLKRKSIAAPTGTNKRDVNVGLEAMAAQIHNERVVFNNNISEEVRQEFKEFPFADHDDSIFSTWMWWVHACNVFERVFL